MINFADTPEDFAINKLYCNSWVATAVVGAAAIGGAVKAYTANEAANAQIGAAGRATQQQYAAALEGWKQIQTYYGLAQDQLKPYQDLGKTGVNELTARMPELTKALPVSQEQLDLQKPLNIDQATLETLPGYQFARTQGLKAVQNSAAARGLGVSGAAQKGAATFATGLADQTYQGQFATEMANRQSAFGRYQQVWENTLKGNQTAYDRLMGIIGAGEAAGVAGANIAGRTGTEINKTFTDVGKTAGGYTIGGANAEAAGINAIGGAVGDVANAVGGYAAYKGLYNGGMGNTPNMTWTKGIAGDQFVPTFR